MNKVRVDVAGQTFSYATPEDAFAAAANLRKTIAQTEAKLTRDLTIVDRLETQAKAFAEYLEQKKAAKPKGRAGVKS